MARIIAARFPTIAQAEDVVSRMPYLDRGDICIFQNSPPGQHGTHAIGGDEDADPDARGAGGTAAGGAAAAGLAAGAIGALGGPVVAIAAAAVGAYSGSLVGAAAGLGTDEEDHPVVDRRQGGVMLSVRIAEPTNESRVIDLFRMEGAMDLERAEGEWRDGDWIDFDPLAAPKLIAPESNVR